MLRKRILIPAFAVLLAASGFFWFRYGRSPQSFETTDYAMSTYIQQTVYGKNGEEAAKNASQQIKDLENLISWRIDTSDVARLNEAAGTDWIKIDPETASVLATSLDVAQESDGAFDPTVLPITSLWDFGGDNQHVPSKADIDKFIKYVDYHNLRVNTQNSTASLKIHYSALDLGGIGKGAACDAAVAAYKSAGADYGIIAAGGSSIGLYGSKADGSPWRIAVRDPKTPDDNAGSMGQLNLSSGFVSTSGTYEQYFVVNGITYHHLLNSKTGYPENNGLVSDTVVLSSGANNGALSDALSTACFILGREKGEALLKQYHAEGLFIDTAGKVYVTDGLKDKFQITNSQYTLADEK